MECDWSIKDEGNIKNKTLSLLPPTSNVVNRTNSDEDYLIREITSPIDSVSAVTEDPMVPYNDIYHQKLPISFISPKDWQKYLHFMTSIADNYEVKESTSAHRGKNGRILRLLNSFHKLYQEYSSVCSRFTPCLQSAGDTTRQSQLCTKNNRQTLSENLQAGDKADSFDSIEEIMVDIGVQTTITFSDYEYFDFVNKSNEEMFFNDSQNYKSMPTSLIPRSMKVFLAPARKLKKCLKQLTYSSNKSHFVDHHNKCFDKIIKTENNIHINITEVSQHQFVVFHKLTMNSRDCTKFKLPNSKDIQVPLAIELLLPKIQMKIETILNECPFLCDPLEVAAELRQFGYDQQACIKYFRTTKCLRALIEEMMPPSVGNMTHNVHDDSQPRSSASSVLSTHSQQESQDKSDNSNETVTALNSNANLTNVNNHSSKQNTGISVDRIFTAVKELCSFTDNKTSNTTKLNCEVFNNSSRDCITQTSMVHFFMDDRNLETFFKKVRQYLLVIRQLHAETREEVDYLRKQLSCVFTSLKSHIALLINQNNDKLLSAEQHGKMLTLSRQVEELKLKLKKEEKRRRCVYNMMQEQMGNIRVYCRCRQILDGFNVLEIIGNETITIPLASPNEKFEFDKVFHPGLSQVDIYEEFRPLVMSFIDGYNVCFITYGGEASGKTYTLIGGNDGSNQQGLMQRALTTILTEERLRQRDWEYKITACVVEIYNDNCIDVLSGENNIQLYVDNGMETAYQKLKSVPITNEADAEALMQVCRVKRKVAKTALNPASSRSHLITLIRLQGRSKIHGESICSFLCLCDLAGFEDIIKAETQTNKVLSKEAGYINRSLTAFNRVFVSLRKQDPNTVSYRDTKLTHLLKPFLTNSGKCALIVTVRNDKRSLGSTQNTLRFGRETRGVTLGRARRQVNLNSQVSV